MNPQPPDESFRALWRELPAGVAVVTSIDSDGAPRGLTCTAVCPVSSDPPSLLIVVSRGSRTLVAITTSGSFVVNFLRADQAALARRFASDVPDKFAEVEWGPAPALGGAPALTKAAAAFVACSVETVTVSGDHLVIVGRAHTWSASPDAMLIHAGGAFR